MTKSQRKKEFKIQLELGKMPLRNHRFEMSFYHLENAHILGQKHLYRHIASHYWMLIHGIKTKNIKEVFGQITRIIASVFFTNIWVPKGNTGGANISPIKSIPVREELQKYFSK